MTDHTRLCATQRTYLGGQALLTLAELKSRRFTSNGIASSAPHHLGSLSALSGRGNQLLQVAQHRTALQSLIAPQRKRQLSAGASPPSSGKACR